MPPHLSDQDLLARLVAEDSTSRNSNRPLADFLCDYLDRPGIAIERIGNEDETKINVLARIGPDATDDRRGLVLSGHLDVVPAQEPEWESDPFELVVRGGAYYGRGTCDMKGFDALAVNVFVAVERERLRAPLALVLTYDEEMGSLGIQQFARTWSGSPPLPRSALIGEPTSLQAVRMHKGHLKLRLALRGRSAHSGSPHLGRNAIEPAGHLINALSDLRVSLMELRAATSDFFPGVPFAVLTVSGINGGIAHNVIPDRCDIDVGVRLLPGMSSRTIIDRIEAIAAEAVGGTDVEHELIVVNDNPPMMLDESAAVHRILCELIGQVESHGASFSSDAGVLQRDLGMECVLFGPGTIEVAHRPNEFVPIDEFKEAKSTIEALVDRCCTQ